MKAKNNKPKQNRKQPPKQKAPLTFWVRGPNGKPSISATFATVSFFTTTAVYIVSIFEKIGPYAIRPFDAAACGIYLVPIMSLYFGRRWTDSRFGNNMNQYYDQRGPRNNQLRNSGSNNSQHEDNDHENIDEDHFKGVIEEGSDEDNSK